MNRFKIISAALCFSLMATGCVSSKKTPAVNTTVPSAAATTEKAPAETTAGNSAGESETSGAEQSAHKVNVEIITKMTYSDGTNELSSVYPRVTVDGKEAAEINTSLSTFIEKNYPMEKDGDYVDGFSTKIVWGVKDNILSIVIYASDTGTDYYTCSVFNYDTGTLKAAENSAVTKVLGMTDDEFFSKTTEVLEKNCSADRGFDLTKILAAVNYDKTTPYVTSSGKAGVAATVFFDQNSQFSGTESVRCFNLETAAPD